VNRAPFQASQLTLHGPGGFPLVQPGDALAPLILAAFAREGLRLQDEDVLVVAQKIVSKSEGRIVDLSTVTPGARARDLAERTGKDARVVELILQESREILRAVPGLIVAVHLRGWVMANAGIDQSNVAADRDVALLLPQDPDASAARLQQALERLTQARLGVVISDSFGRPWRDGVTGVALGVAGWPALIDRRGQPDLFGRALERTQIAHADELAAAASLVQGQAAEGRPVVLIRGARADGAQGRGRDLLREPAQELFR
jgi:coenzyme F420-0:L-glutamate ligase / coenzyme F420-1:gamma-L-glutamate ligase